MLLCIALALPQVAPPVSLAPCTLQMELPHPRHQIPIDLDDEFGADVATDGEFVAVGIPEFDGRGAVVVFRQLANGAWAVDERLEPVTLVAGDRYGASVDLQGGVLVVGATGVDGPVGNEGAAYVYRRVSGHWVREAELLPDYATLPQGFGNDVSVHGDSVAVGDPSGHRGYVFRHAAGSWPLEAAVTLPLPGALTSFGEAIAIHGDLLVVGDDRYNPPTMGKPGIAFTYKRTGTSWAHADTLLNPNPNPSADHFAEGIDLHGSWAVVGTPQLDAHGLTASGTVYAFELDANGVQVQMQEVNPGAALQLAGDAFGWDVAIEGTTMIVGAPFRSVGPDTDVGAAFQFDLVNGTWQLTEEFPGSAITQNAWDRMGYSVAVGAVGVAGAPSPGAVGVPGRAFVGTLCAP